MPETAVSVPTTEQEIQEIHVPSISFTKVDKTKGKIQRGIEKFINPLNYKIDNEFDSPNKDVLKPLPPYNTDSRVLKEFEYLCSTTDLEMNSPRINRLQNIVNKMTEGTGLKMRVVIANKGEKLRGFVFPDGTIVLSQSILNQLSSLDEVAGVLGHEISHVRLDTHGRSVDWSVKWLHEGYIDVKPALDIMVKAGFNTLAHGTALEKIGGTERGLEHMTGTTRAAGVTASHAGLHYATSTKPLTPLGAEFHRQSLPTNREILEKILEEKDIVSFKKILPNLHKRDFSNPLHGSRVDPEFVDAYLDVITQRLQSAGYSKEEISLYMINRFQMDIINRPTAYFKNSQEIVEVAKKLEDFDVTKKSDEIRKFLFDENYNSSSTTDYFIKMLHGALENVSDEHGRDPNWTTFDQNDFLEIVELLNNSSVKPDREDLLYLSVDYASHIFAKHLRDERDVQLDEDQIREFYQKVKALNIPIKQRDYYTDPRFYLMMYTNNPSHCEQLAKTFADVFGKPERRQRPAYEFEKIDQFFDAHETEVNPKDFSEFIEEIFVYFRTGVATVEDRYKIIGRIYERIAGLPLSSDVNLLSALNDLENNRGSPDISDQTADTNARLIRLNLQMLTGLALFPFEKRESNAFFVYIQKAIDESGINSSNLTRNQLLQVCQGFFVTTGLQKDEFSRMRSFLFMGKDGVESFQFGYPTVDLHTEERALNISWLQNLSDKFAGQTFSDKDDFIQFIEGDFSQYLKRWSTLSNPRGIFDSFYLYSTVVGRGAREGLAQVLQEPVTDENLVDMHDFIVKYFPDNPGRDASPTKITVLKALERRYLKSATFSFAEKLDFLENHIHSLGVEGAYLLSEQIHSYPEFLDFRTRMGDVMQKEMSGTEALKRVATAEAISTLFAKKFESLFETADVARSKELTTKFCDDWIDHYDRAGDIEGVRYNAQIKKYRLNQEGIEVFRSVHDIFAGLHDLSGADRFVMTQKALTDRGGALTSPENRHKLAQLAIDALRLQPGFMVEVLDAACQKVDAKYGSFAISRMLSPLLFQAHDLSQVDTSHLLANTEVHEGTVYPQMTHPLGELMDEETLLRILNSETANIIDFGQGFFDQNSFYGQLSKERDIQYSRARDAIRELSEKNGGRNDEQANGEPLVDPGTDAVLNGLATLGAPMVYGFQTARQFYSFSEALDRRLDNFYDQNPGTQTYFFWENLYRISEQNPRLRQFLEQELVSLDETVGVGSLYTTKKAVVRKADESTKELAVKLLNPNAEAFVDIVYQEALGVFDQIDRTGTTQDRQFISVARAAAEVSRERCLRDIRDQTFAADDQNFRRVIEQINTEEDGVYHAPDNYLLSYEVKMEDFVPGQNLNSFLRNPEVDTSKKTKSVEAYAKFYFSQFGVQEFAEEGGKYRLVLSNPSVGNCIVAEEGGQMRLGIIDRNMYLRLSSEDIEVIQPLMRGNNRQFMQSFLDRVFEINGRSGIRRNFDMGRLKLQIAGEYLGQRTNGATNEALLFKNILKRMQDSGLEIPLDLRLTIQNIEAMKKLYQRYGVDTNRVITTQ